MGEDMRLRGWFLKAKMRIVPFLFTSNDMHCYLKEQNVSVGEGTIFYNPGTITIDTSRPCLLQIGKHCKITSGVVVLTHDYSRSVLRRVYGEVLGEAGKTVIGDNVFIGMNSIILMGSKIGSNVIVGAGSVVSGRIPDNVVVAGNPARIIRTLDEQYRIRKIRVVDEAVLYTQEFERMYGRVPDIRELDPFYHLFMPRDMEEVRKHGLRMKLGGDNEEEIIHAFLNSEAMFDGYEGFMAYYREKTYGKSGV